MRVSERKGVRVEENERGLHAGMWVGVRGGGGAAGAT